MLDVGPVQQGLSPAARAWPDCMVMFDKSGLVIDLNQAGESLLGYRRAEAVGRSLPELIIPEGEENHPLIVAIAGGPSPDPLKVARVRTRIRARDGRLFPAELTLAETLD